MLKQSPPPSSRLRTGPPSGTPPALRRREPDSPILARCFAASLLINFGLAVWLGFANLYGPKHAPDIIQHARVKVYHPTVKPPVKPPHVKPPPPQHIKPPPAAAPRTAARVRPAPPRPIPSSPLNLDHTAKGPAQNVKPVGPTTNSGPPQSPVPPQPPGSHDNGNPQQPPKPPFNPDPVKTGPVVTPPSKDTLAPVQRREASVDDSSIPPIDTGSLGIDLSTITGPCVVSFTVDITGRIKNPRIQKSSGNADFDDACLKAIRQARGEAGIQDGTVYEAQAEYRFSAN